VVHEQDPIYLFAENPRVKSKKNVGICRQSRESYTTGKKMKKMMKD